MLGAAVATKQWALRRHGPVLLAALPGHWRRTALAAVDAEEILHLGRGEHSGGFVEDKELGVARQRLLDLQLLPEAHSDRSPARAPGSSATPWEASNAAARARASRIGHRVGRARFSGRP